MQTIEQSAPLEQHVSDEEADRLLEVLRNSRWTRYRNRVLGPKLLWLEARAFLRLDKWCAELERLEQLPADAWRPRVKFQYYEGPTRICPHGNTIPMWEYEHLLEVVERREDALATIRLIINILDRRLGDIQHIFWTRHREIQQLEAQNKRLKILLAPRRGRIRTA